MQSLKLQLGSDIHVLQAAQHDDAADLLAVGTDHSVLVVLVSDQVLKIVASFHIGQRITALAFSPRTVSQSSSEEWLIELVAASANFGLHLLTKQPNSDETIFAFGGGLSGHHARVNDMTFCGGRGEDSARYVATVSDDKLLFVWDLYPSDSQPSSESLRMSSSPPPRPQPTAYTIAFPHQLSTVCSHSSSSREFVVSDVRGSIFLTDWRSDPEDSDFDSWRLVELVEPFALAASSTGTSIQSGGCAAWRRDRADIVGAVYGSRYSIWDISKLQGGKPMTGSSFPQGGHRFRWCPTVPEYFAISTLSPAKGAVINIHNTTYAQPTAITLAPRPHFVRDFDWLVSRTPRLAAAVGRLIIVCSVAIDS